MVGRVSSWVEGGGGFGMSGEILGRRGRLGSYEGWVGKECACVEQGCIRYLPAAAGRRSGAIHKYMCGNVAFGGVAWARNIQRTHVGIGEGKCEIDLSEPSQVGFLYATASNFPHLSNFFFPISRAKTIG